MLRPWVILVATLSIITSIQARPTPNNALHSDTSTSMIPPEPTTLISRHYQVTKREALILMDPALEQMANAQKHHHHAHTPALQDTHPPSPPSASSASAVDSEKKKETKVSSRNVEPFPRYLAERSWSVLLSREPHDVYTSDHIPNDQPAGAQFSEGPGAAPQPPGFKSHFIENGQNGGGGQAAGGGGSTSHVSSQGLGGLGLAGLGGSSGGGGGGSGLNVLGGLIGG